MRAYLRQDAPILALGTVLIALGILSVAVWRLRNGSDERGILWFGALSGAYGLRMIFSSDVFHFTATVDKAQRLKWSYPEWAVAYTLIPLASLLLSDVFPEWNRILLRRLRLLAGIFAAIAIATDMIRHRAGSFQLPYSAIVVIGLAAVVMAVPHGRYRRLLRTTGLVFMAAVLIENAWRFYSTSYAVRLEEIEALSFTCWLAALGAVMAGRIAGREK